MHLMWSLVVWCTLLVGTHAFLTPRSHLNDASTSLLDASTTTDVTPVNLEIVVFGVGDLRVDDHLGLQAAVQKAAMDNTSGARTIVVPLFVMTNAMLANLPGAVAHTVDTATMLSAALYDLDTSLRTTVHADLGLRTILSQDQSMTAMLREVMDAYGATSDAAHVRVHMCDLGDVDNQMRYSPFGQYQFESTNEFDSSLQVVPWTNALRHEPWQTVDTLPVSFPTYEAQYVAGQPPIIPVTLDSLESGAASWAEPPLRDVGQSSVPTPDHIVERLCQAVKRDLDLCRLEVNTGLYGTHWGGLTAASIGGRSVLSNLQAYVTECSEDSVAWSQHPLYTLRTCTRNGQSLEHMSMAWQLAGDGTYPAGNVQTNWLAGEAMLRYLAAPLLFGTVSPRRIWHMASPQVPSIIFVNPLQRLVEGQEWHRLLAAHNVRTNASYQPHIGTATTTYKYWRYHGFLCRYACTEFAASSTTRRDTENTQGVLLVHGFGASGTQWNKAMSELSRLDTGASQGLAPDLIGFGQSEKPAISYTGYMWDSQMMDFTKEIAMHQHRWTTFVTGGNSIGGFTSLSLAACDAATARTVSSTGAPGTGTCVGLVLMNSAGPVKTQDEIIAEHAEAASNGTPLSTVAQATALQALPMCRPPPRPVARIFGHVLLGYLRPRIQSICRNLYPTNPAAVDTFLCTEIERDSMDPGAINVMMAGAKLPPPRTANELLGANFGAAVAEQQVAESCYTGPVLIAQGVLDPLNNSTDRMFRYQSLRDGIEVRPIQAGHCPHDELPDQVATSIAAWMTTSVSRATATRFASSVPR